MSTEILSPLIDCPTEEINLFERTQWVGFLRAEYTKRHFYKVTLNEVAQAAYDHPAFQSLLAIRRVFPIDCEASHRCPFYLPLSEKPSPFFFISQSCQNTFCKFKLLILSLTVKYHNENFTLYHQTFFDLRIPSDFQASPTLCNIDAKNLHDLSYSLGYLAYELFYFSDPQLWLRLLFEQHATIANLPAAETFICEKDLEPVKGKLFTLPINPQEMDAYQSLLAELAKNFYCFFITKRELDFTEPILQINKFLKNKSSRQPYQQAACNLLIAVPLSAKRLTEAQHLEIQKAMEQFLTYEGLMNEAVAHRIHRYHKTLDTTNVQENLRQRLLGLWCWDLVHIHGKTLSDAINDIRSSQLFLKVKQLSCPDEVFSSHEKIADDYKTLHRLYHSTNKQIEIAQVISNAKAERT